MAAKHQENMKNEPERQVIVATYYAPQVFSKFQKEKTSTRHTLIRPKSDNIKIDIFPIYY